MYEDLLDRLLSSQREIRVAAEQNLAEAGQKPNELATGLIQILQNSDNSTRRQQAAVTLKNQLYAVDDQRGDMWEKLAPEVKVGVMNGLLTRLRDDSNASVLASISDCVIAVSLSVQMDGSWEELPGALHSIITGRPDVNKIAGLHALGGTLGTIKVTMTDVANLLNGIFSNETNVAVQVEVFNVIESSLALGPEEWTPCQMLLPQMHQCIVGMITRNDSDEAERALQIMTEMLENDPTFITPRSHDFIGLALQTINNASIDDDVRGAATEFVVTLAEMRPTLCVKFAGFIGHVLEALMCLMLTVRDDCLWLETDAEPPNHYRSAETGIDRISEIYGGDQVIGPLFERVNTYTKSPGWEHQFVGTMALSQAIEYASQDQFDSAIGHIASILMLQLNSNDPRLRFAALHAIGQIALDHGPQFQQSHLEFLPAIINQFNYPSHKIQEHSFAAYVNFAEDLDAADLHAELPRIVEILRQRLTAPDIPDWVREQAVTGVSVTAGVLEKEFAPFCATFVPPIKALIMDSRARQNFKLIGKNFECISIICISVGMEMCGGEAEDIVNMLIEMWGADKSGESSLDDYIAESLRRMCKTMTMSFVPFLGKVVPLTLESFQTPSVDFNSIMANMNDFQFFQTDPNLIRAYRTSEVESMIASWKMLETFLEVVGEAYAPYLETTFQAVMPIIGLTFPEDIKLLSLLCVGKIFAVARTVADKRREPASYLAEWLQAVIKANMKTFDAGEALCQKPTLAAVCSGIAAIIQSAGAGMMHPAQVSELADHLLSQLNDSIDRRRQLGENIGKEPDDDTREGIKASIKEEIGLRMGLLEFLGALMEIYPDEYVQHASEKTLSFLTICFNPRNDVEDITLGMYVVDDVVEKLGSKGMGMWPRFLETMVTCVGNKNAELAQAAAYGVASAAKYAEFEFAASKAADDIATVVERPPTTGKDYHGATDNAILALGQLIKYHSNQFPDRVDRYLTIWYNALPLKSDTDEAGKVHEQFLDYVIAQNPIFFHPDGRNAHDTLIKLGKIYRTAFSSEAVDSKILSVCSKMDPMRLQELSNNTTRPAEKYGIARLVRDVNKKRS